MDAKTYWLRAPKFTNQLVWIWWVRFRELRLLPIPGTFHSLLRYLLYLGLLTCFVAVFCFTKANCMSMFKCDKVNTVREKKTLWA